MVAIAAEDDLRAKHWGNNVALDAKAQNGQWINGGYVDLTSGQFYGSGLKAERWVRQSLRYMIDNNKLRGVQLD